jgi:DNA (cytosine-5)-methyltransferase 1
VSIRPQLTLDLSDEIFIDGFAGGGGASTGYELATGRDVDLACNHCELALAMHLINHPQTRHFPEDIRKWRIWEHVRGRCIGGAWYSPDCKHFSKAKGGKPRDKFIRGLAWVIIHMINKCGPLAPRVLFLENVEEFLTWGPLLPSGDINPRFKGWFFGCFVGALRRRGYVVEWRELRACDYGAPTIRKRLYLIARRDGQPIVWPQPTHAAETRRHVGRGPRLKPHRIVAECIDWSLPCPSIFLSREEGRKVRCKRPLVKATLKRLAQGTKRFVLEAERPFIVGVGSRAGQSPSRGVDEPLSTITATKRGQHAIAMPFVAYSQQGGAVRPADAPLHTITASRKDANQVAAVFVARQFGTSTGHAVSEPAKTITSGCGGGHNQVAAVFLAQHNGGMVGHEASEPMSTIAGRGSNQALVGAFVAKYYGTAEDGQPVSVPLHAATAKARFGLAQYLGAIPPFTSDLEAKARRVAAFLREHGVEFEGEYAMVGDFVIYDIGMRMFTPRELFRAHGFPEGYVIDRGVIIDEAGRRRVVKLSKTAQIRMCGNSVCPPVAAALIRANLPEMCLHPAQTLSAA